MCVTLMCLEAVDAQRRHDHKHACKCQLFTDEGSRRLPKHLNYCFSVVASAMNRSIND